MPFAAQIHTFTYGVRNLLPQPLSPGVRPSQYRLGRSNVRLRGIPRLIVARSPTAHVLGHPRYLRLPEKLVKIRVEQCPFAQLS
jgi:hypothetical protein